MKKLTLSFLFALSCIVAFAQNDSSERFSVSVELGKGVLFGKSNLSPFGIDYRGYYSGGITCNIKALYRFEGFWTAGLKYNLFVTSGNYALADETRVADDVELHYIAPQVGIKRAINQKLDFSCTVGAGYLRYKDKGLCNGEFKYASDSWGGNLDMMFEYELFEHFAVNGGFSFLGGNEFKKMKATMGDEKETFKPDKWNRIYIQRIDFLLGIVARF